MLGSRRKASFCTTWMASRWVWCIFQLPLMSGFLASGIGRLSQGLDSGEITLLDVFQRCAPTGGNVIDLAVETELLQGRGAVAAADDGESPALGHGLGDGAGPGLEPGILEHA